MCADTRELRGDVKLCQEFLLTSTTSTLVRWPKEPSRESFGTSRVLPRSWRPTCPNTQFGRLAPSFRTLPYFNTSKYWSKLVEIHVRFKQDMENSGPEFQVIKICCIHRYFCEYFRPQGRFQAPIRIKTQAEQLGTIKLSLSSSGLSSLVVKYKFTTAFWNGSMNWS